MEEQQKEEPTELQVDSVVRADKIFKNCQRGLQLAENYSKQANERFEECKREISKMDSIHTKLELVCSEISKQLQVKENFQQPLKIRLLFSIWRKIILTLKIFNNILRSAWRQHIRHFRAEAEEDIE